MKVPGITSERLKELDPTIHLGLREFKEILEAQVKESKYYLDKNCPGLPDEIKNAMNF